MTTNTHYSNVNWARKAMTILINKMVLFETVRRERSENQDPIGGEYEHGIGEQCRFGEYELGVKFHAEGQGWVVMWPTCESELSEIRSLVE